MLLRSRNLNVRKAVTDEESRAGKGGLIAKDGLVAKDGHVALKRAAPFFPRDDDKECGAPAVKLQIVPSQTSQPLLQFDDFDKNNEKDIMALAPYAQDIFTWYKIREALFKVRNYYSKQTSITPDIRAKLVDWMVGVQESFELNHETLYLAVKIFDLYMDKTDFVLDAHSFQLIASTSVFIASKFDERAAPLIEDFLYICEDKFNRDQIMAMEREVFQTVEFDLGAPLSYRFLRRYARVTKTTMETLTLARYILETSLMSLDYCRISESLIAAASFLLAVRMERSGQDWSDALQHYSGYTLDEVEPLSNMLNHMIIERKAKHPDLLTVYRKYSHEIFHEVALKPSLPDRLVEDHYNTFR